MHGLLVLYVAGFQMCLAQDPRDWLYVRPNFRVSDFSRSRGREEEVHGPQKRLILEFTVHLPASCNMQDYHTSVTVTACF